MAQRLYKAENDPSWIPLAASSCPAIGGGVRSGKDAAPTLYARTLSRAAEVVGGEEQLVLQLRVAPSQLALWLAGKATPPGDVFLNAVDIVGEHNIQAFRNRPDGPDAGAA